MNDNLQLSIELGNLAEIRMASIFNGASFRIRGDYFERLPGLTDKFSDIFRLGNAGHSLWLTEWAFLDGDPGFRIWWADRKTRRLFISPRVPGACVAILVPKKESIGVLRNDLQGRPEFIEINEWEDHSESVSTENEQSKFTGNFDSALVLQGFGSVSPDSTLCFCALSIDGIDEASMGTDTFYSAGICKVSHYAVWDNAGSEIGFKIIARGEPGPKYTTPRIQGACLSICHNKDGVRALVWTSDSAPPVWTPALKLTPLA